MTDKKYKMIDGQLVEMTPEEVEEFMASLAQFRRKLPKSTIWARLVALGQATAAKTALDANPVAWGQWFSPDWPEVFVDDPGLLTFLDALGLTEGQITAVTA